MWRRITDMGRKTLSQSSKRRPDIWRQGDIYIQEVEHIPEEAQKLEHCVLAEGEVTGHKHQVVDLETAELYEKDGTLYLRVKAESAIISHEEHGPITLPAGSYRAWRQREYVPSPIQRSRTEETYRYVSD